MWLYFSSLSYLSYFCRILVVFRGLIRFCVDVGDGHTPALGGGGVHKAKKQERKETLALVRRALAVLQVI